MKKAKTSRRRPEMLPEYDLRGARRGKYARRYARGTNLVALAPDVAALFRDSESVNDAQRVLGRRGRGRKQSA